MSDDPDYIPEYDDPEPPRDNTLWWIALWIILVFMLCTLPKSCSLEINVRQVGPTPATENL